MSAANKLVKMCIFDFLVHGDKLGMQYSEGLWRPLSVLPSHVNSLDELIDYGTEMCNKINDAFIIDTSESYKMSYYTLEELREEIKRIETYSDYDNLSDLEYEWNEVIDESSIFNHILEKIIPSQGCSTGDRPFDKIEELSERMVRYAKELGIISKNLPLDMIKKHLLEILNTELLKIE